MSAVAEKGHAVTSPSPGARQELDRMLSPGRLALRRALGHSGFWLGGVMLGVILIAIVFFGTGAALATPAEAPVTTAGSVGGVDAAPATPTYSNQRVKIGSQRDSGARFRAEVSAPARRFRPPQAAPGKVRDLNLGERKPKDGGRTAANTPAGESAPAAAETKFCTVSPAIWTR